MLMQVKDELLQLLCEGKCAMTDDQVENLILLFPTEVGVGCDV
jgi:hypothetical protein